MNPSLKSTSFAAFSSAFLDCSYIINIFLAHSSRNWAKICVSSTRFCNCATESGLIEVSVQECISIGVLLKRDCHVIVRNVITVSQSCFAVVTDNSLFLQTTVTIKLEVTLPRDVKTFGSNDFSNLGSGKFGVKAHWRKAMDGVGLSLDISRRNFSLCVLLVMPSIFGKKCNQVVAQCEEYRL